VFLAALLAAEPALATVPVVLAGVPMNGAILGARLVVPGPRLTGRVLSVRRFVEDWPPEAAPRFKARGALWDTSVFMGRAATLGKLAAQQAPAGAATTARLGPVVNTPRAPVPETLQRSPARMPASPWLQGLDGGLGVVAVRGSGWSAWSSPEQVMESLRDPHQLDRLLCRIHQHQQGIDPAQLRRRFRSEASQRSTPALYIAR
jgi:hypothetical protein